MKKLPSLLRANVVVGCNDCPSGVRPSDLFPSIGENEWNERKEYKRKNCIHERKERKYLFKGVVIVEKADGKTESTYKSIATWEECPSCGKIWNKMESDVTLEKLLEITRQGNEHTEARIPNR